MYLNQDCDYRKYGDFVSLQRLGEEFGIDYDKLIERLEKGCSLYVALSVAEHYDIEVKQYPKRGTHYIIRQMVRQTVFRGSEKELAKWL